MRLIEKKCPNCGASLEFNDSDKSCKCQYCHRAFEIERDLNVADLADQFNLSELKGTAGTAAKVIGGVVVGHYVIAALIGLFALGMFGVIGYNAYKHMSTVKNKTADNPIQDILEELEDSNTLLSDVSELSNRDFETIDFDARMEISHSAKGVNDSRHSYSLDGSATREKIYIAYKEDSNYLVVVMKGTYKDVFHQESQYTIYMPVVYQNIEKNNLSFTLANPKLDAPEYYFGNDKTSYYYGYGSLEEAYNAVVKPLEDEYKISEK